MRRLAYAVLVLLNTCARQTPVSAPTLRIAGLGPLENLSPERMSGYPMLVKGLVFALVLEPRSEGGWHSQVLQEWTRLGPGRYRLKLEPSLRFSDGSAVSNEDLIASLAASAIRGTERAGWVEIEPIEPAAPIDPLLLHAVLFKQGPEGFVGTGPFSVVMQDPEHLVLRRVKPIPGRIAEVELVAYASAREAFAGALRGEVGALLMPDPGEIELLDGVSRFQLIRAPSLHAVAAIFNARRLARDERRALAEAIPIREVGRAHGGDCEVEAPQQHLSSIPSGPPLDLLTMETDASVVRVALALRRALGLRGSASSAGTENVPFSTQRGESGQFDILVSPIQVSPPDAAMLAWRTGMPSNYGGYSNRAVDEALDAGDYRQAQRLLADDPPAIFICRRMRSAAIDVRVKNPRLGPYDLLESLPDWEVNP